MAIRKKAQSTPRRKTRVVVRPATKEELADIRVREVKRILGTTLPEAPMPIMRKDEPRCAPQAFHMNAKLILQGADGLSSQHFIARIPIVITTVPELPEAVICEDHVYVVERTNPLTYVSVFAAQATRL